MENEKCHRCNGSGKVDNPFFPDQDDSPEKTCDQCKGTGTLPGKQEVGMLNERDYLLICLSEECAEIQKEVSKALRFGLDDFNPNSNEQVNNSLRIEQELVDMNTVIKMLIDGGYVSWNLHVEERMRKKREKIAKYMEYSRQKRCLSGKVEIKPTEANNF